MNNEISVVRRTDISTTDLQIKHRAYLKAGTADNTRNAYQSATRHFERWGGRLPTDKNTIIQYLLQHAEHLSPRTLDVRLTALSQWHQYQKFNDPCKDIDVKKTLEGIRRVHGKPKQKAKALTLAEISKMIEWLQAQPDTYKRLRDLAMLQIGYFGAFRRSELVKIEIKDLRWEPEGLLKE